MKKEFFKNITCTNSDDCFSEIVNSFSKDHPLEVNGKRTGHINIEHTPNLHRIAVFYYENDGEWESEDNEFKTVKQKANDCVKSNKMPNADFENKINQGLLKSAKVKFTP